MYENLDVCRTHLHSMLSAVSLHASNYGMSAVNTCKNLSVQIRNIPLNIKIVLGVTSGCTLVGVLAFYLRRRRKRRRGWREDVIEKEVSSTSQQTSFKEERATMVNLSWRSPYPKSSRCSTPLSPVTHTSPRQSSSLPNGSLMHSMEAGSCVEDDNNSISTVTLTHNEVESKLSPPQRCSLAMEHVGCAIQQLEEALHQLQDEFEDFEGGDSAVGSSRLNAQMRDYLEQAQQLQRAYERDNWEAYSAGIALEATLKELDKEYEDKRRKRTGTLSSDNSFSELESFHSAITFLTAADLSKLHEEMGQRPQFPVFEQSLLELEENGIPFRTLRTQMLQCKTDSEFLAKLNCLRPAFQMIFSDEDTKQYFKDAGKQLLMEIMEKANKDSEEVSLAYDSLLKFVEDPANTSLIEEELRTRGVPMLTFYDVVIDFLILDAFDDLANPPSTVISVCQNRWLSASFKETALSTAVWSVLKAKRRMLKFPKGFIAHFYAVAEHTSPVFAWGFMGPDTPVKTLCHVFKDQTLGFLCDIFNFQFVRYTTHQSIADDVLKCAKERLNYTLSQMARVRPQLQL